MKKILAWLGVILVISTIVAVFMKNKEIVIEVIPAEMQTPSSSPTLYYPCLEGDKCI